MKRVLAKNDDGVLRLTLNRPDKLNALAGTMREDLLEHLLQGERDPSVRVVVIGGRGRGFCAGGDVRNMNRLHTRRGLDEFSKILDAANAVARTLHEYTKPTLAVVNGPAAGGGANLALACDLRIGSTECSFTQSFIRIGLGPDWGGSYVLPRIVGPDRARELLLTGRKVSAEEALELGFLHELVAPEVLAATADRRAARLARLSPVAVAAVKEALGDAPPASLGSALERERSAQIRCFLSEEAGAAFDAFSRRKAKAKREAS